MFDGASEQRDEAVELEMKRVDAVGTGLWDPCHSPTQVGPDVDQEQGKAQDKEAKGRFA